MDLNEIDAKRIAVGDVMETPGSRSDPQVQRPPLAAMNGSNGHSTQHDNEVHDSRPTNARNGAKKAGPQSYVKPLKKQQLKDEDTIRHYSQAMSFGMRRLQTLGSGKLMILIQQITDMRHEISEEERYYTDRLRANYNQRNDEVLDLLERKKKNMEAYREALSFRSSLREILDSRVEYSDEEEEDEEDEQSVEYMEVLTAKTLEAKMITHYSEVLDFELKPLQYLTEEQLIALIEQVPDLLSDVKDCEYAYVDALRKNNDVRSKRAWKLLAKKQKMDDMYLFNKRTLEKLRKVLHNRIAYGAPSSRMIPVPVDSHASQAYHQNRGNARSVNNPLQYLTEEQLIALIEQVPDLLSDVKDCEYAYVDALRKNNDVRSKRAWKLLAKKQKMDDMYLFNKRTLEKLRKVLHNRIAYGAPSSRMIPVPVDSHASQAYHQNRGNARSVNNRAEAAPRPAQVEHPTPFPKTPSHNTPKPAVQSALPIDGYREEILYRIAMDRVTIIQGETGCGKSSRLPVMLLEDATSRGMPCRIMVSTVLFLHMSNLPSPSPFSSTSTSSQ